MEMIDRMGVVDIGGLRGPILRFWYSTCSQRPRVRTVSESSSVFPLNYPLPPHVKCHEENVRKWKVVIIPALKPMSSSSGSNFEIYSTKISMFRRCKYRLPPCCKRESLA